MCRTTKPASKYAALNNATILDKFVVKVDLVIAAFPAKYREKWKELEKKAEVSGLRKDKPTRKKRKT